MPFFIVFILILIQINLFGSVGSAFERVPDDVMRQIASLCLAFPERATCLRYNVTDEEIRQSFCPSSAVVNLYLIDKRWHGHMRDAYSERIFGLAASGIYIPHHHYLVGLPLGKTLAEKCYLDMYHAHNHREFKQFVDDRDRIQRVGVDMPALVGDEESTKEDPLRFRGFEFVDPHYRLSYEKINQMSEVQFPPDARLKGKEYTFANLVKKYAPLYESIVKEPKEKGCNLFTLLALALVTELMNTREVSINGHSRDVLFIFFSLFFNGPFSKEAKDCFLKNLIDSKLMHFCFEMEMVPKLPLISLSSDFPRFPSYFFCQSFLFRACARRILKELLLLQGTLHLNLVSMNLDLVPREKIEGMAIMKRQHLRKKLAGLYCSLFIFNKNDGNERDKQLLSRLQDDFLNVPKDLKICNFLNSIRVIQNDQYHELDYFEKRSCILKINELLPSETLKEVLVICLKKELTAISGIDQMITSNSDLRSADLTKDGLSDELFSVLCEKTDTSERAYYLDILKDIDAGLGESWLDDEFVFQRINEIVDSIVVKTSFSHQYVTETLLELTRYPEIYAIIASAEPLGKLCLLAYKSFFKRINPFYRFVDSQYLFEKIIAGCCKPGCWAYGVKALDLFPAFEENYKLFQGTISDKFDTQRAFQFMKNCFDASKASWFFLFLPLVFNRDCSDELKKLIATDQELASQFAALVFNAPASLELNNTDPLFYDLVPAECLSSGWEKLKVIKEPPCKGECFSAADDEVPFDKNKNKQVTENTQTGSKKMTGKRTSENLSQGPKISIDQDKNSVFKEDKVSSSSGKGANRLDKTGIKPQKSGGQLGWWASLRLRLKTYQPLMKWVIAAGLGLVFLRWAVLKLSNLVVVPFAR